ncbi:pyrokinin-1 receptor isoform X2 [Stomoxys calcitrans]|uniref:G-protein coupled receptors family 1 profile domain-containing protein n=1 Tax=Stomoxys calcitrans TaxID=35570 RepID=A0A1I8PSB1_STOCA|nr:pyrokinin-1 receptor isoform X2 [Stomoxys calcitrans]
MFKKEMINSTDAAANTLQRMASSGSSYEQTTSPQQSESNQEMEPKRDSLQVVIPLTIIYTLIFITGVIGNIITCIVIKKNRSMHTATNYYLFSLAISDFLLLISGVPQEIYLTWSKYPYVFGETFCIGRGILAEMSGNATVLTITAFTVERYVAICHPFLGQAISKLSRAIRIIILIWILSILTAVPQALQFGIIPIHGVEKCVVVRIIIQHSFQLSTYIFFFAPMSIIFVLYLLIGIHLHRADVIAGGGAIASAGTLEAANEHCQHGKNMMMTRFRRDISGDLNDRMTRGQQGRQGMKSVQSDTILYRYSGGGQVNAVRGRMNQIGTKRVLKMLVAVVICFFLCWAPFHAQRLIAVYGWVGVQSDGPSNDLEEGVVTEAINNAGSFTITLNEDASTTGVENDQNTANNNHHEVVYTVMTYISGVLYYLSTCINPLLYNLMSNKFRQAFKSILFGKKSTNQRRSQNSHRSIGRKVTLTSTTTTTRDSIDSELQTKVSLMQTCLNERKMNSEMIP